MDNQQHFQNCLDKVRKPKYTKYQPKPYVIVRKYGCCADAFEIVGEADTEIDAELLKETLEANQPALLSHTNIDGSIDYYYEILVR